MATNPRPGIGNGLTMLVAIAALVVTAGLLFQVAKEATNINQHATTIVTKAANIHQDTDAISQLNRTNALALSILGSASPLPKGLGTAVSLAKTIDGYAGTIQGSATAINGTAGGIEGNAKSILGTADTINSTASAINTTASTILGTAKAINTDVFDINSNLNHTIGFATGINGDAGNIVNQAKYAENEASCIDREANANLKGNAGCP